MENERLRERLRSTNEELAKCKDQLENAFQVVSAPLPLIGQQASSAADRSDRTSDASAIAPLAPRPGVMNGFAATLFTRQKGPVAGCGRAPICMRPRQTVL